MRRVCGVGIDPSRRPCADGDSHRQHLRRRAAGDLAVPAGRPAEAGCTGADPDDADSHDSRAPLMARVSFADVKRVAIALGWVVLFIAIGVGITIGLSELLPGWGGRDWAIARNSVYEVIGFALATWIVGR